MPSMFTLPWRWTQNPKPDHPVVFASRFDAKGVKDRWILLTAAIRLRRGVLSSPGALGVSVRAHPVTGHYFTMSMWQDEASLLAFAHGADHRAVVRRIAKMGPVRGVLVSKEAGSGRPRWADTLQWVAASEPGPYRRDPTPAQAPRP